MPMISPERRAIHQQVMSSLEDWIKTQPDGVRARVHERLWTLALMTFVGDRSIINRDYTAAELLAECQAELLQDRPTGGLARRPSDAGGGCLPTYGGGREKEPRE